MQPYFLEPGAPAECADGRAICGAINRLASTLRQAGGQIVWITTHATDESRIDWRNLAELQGPDIAGVRWTELAPGHARSELWPEMEPVDGDWQIIKTRYSAFHGESSPLTTKLRADGIDTVLIAGVATNVCCESSARDAMMYGFRTILLADANAAATRDAHLSALATFMTFFGDVRSSDEIEALL